MTKKVKQLAIRLVEFHRWDAAVGFGSHEVQNGGTRRWTSQRIGLRLLLKIQRCLVVSECGRTKHERDDHVVGP